MASSSKEVGSLAVAGPASREEAVSGVTAEYPDTSKLYPGKSWIRGYAVSVDPSRFSRNAKYISGWIRGYAVSVDPSLSQEMGSIFLGGYADTQ